MGYYSAKLMGMQAEAVSSIPTDYILRYDFNGDVLDKSTNALDGIKTGTAAYGTGRKAGTQCLDFTEGCVKTNGNLIIGSDKVSVSLWMKTAHTVSGIVCETSVNPGLNNAFYIDHYENRIPGISVKDRTTVENIKKASYRMNDGNWNHLVVIIDRSLSANNSTKIYINNSINSLDILYEQNSDTSGNFADNILFIGQRNAEIIPYIGSLQDMRIYNRVLTTEEITVLYNE